MGQAKADTFAEDMREMGVSGSGTHDEARSVASRPCQMETTRRPVFQKGQEDLSLK